MGSALLVLALIVAVFVAGVSLVVLLFWCFTGQLRPGRRPLGGRRAPQPVHRPIERVATDLRRLAHQLALVPAGAAMARRRGLQAAYDDVLAEAAGLLEVPHRLFEATTGHARDVERLRVQAALREAGLVVPD